MRNDTDSTLLVIYRKSLLKMNGNEIWGLIVLYES